MATQAATLCGASALVGAAVGKGVKKQAGVSKKLNQTRLSVSASASSKDNEPTPSSNLFSKLATGLAAVATTVSLTAGPMDAVALTTGSPAINPAIPDVGVLIKGQPIKDARALLRYALPINNQAIKEVQQPLEAITEDLRLPGSKAFDPVERNIRQANRVLNQSKDKILADVAEKNKAEGRELIEKLQDGLQEFQKIVERRNRDSIQPKQKELLAIVGDIEEAMVGAFPYQIPAEFKGYPVLKGRANVEMTVRPLNNPNLPEVVFEVVVDGYNAPVTSGNFVDLVKRGFYDGMEIQRADGFVVQTGDPEGPAEGFVDPATGKERRIPLEVFVEGDKEPVYHDTLEDLGRYRALPKIPFNAFGTMAMAREEFDNDSASSQIFWLLKESELTPSSANILDGRYAVFGYIVENADFLADLKVGDVISTTCRTTSLTALPSPLPHYPISPNPPPALSPLWPARVDLVIRSYVSDNFLLTAFLTCSPIVPTHPFFSPIPSPLWPARVDLVVRSYVPLWPARVDLVVRSYVSDNFFLTAFLFASIEQMWPAGIGDVILVLDESDRHVEDIVPPWVKIYYEKNYLGLTPKLVQQWSYLWADNYTTAPYIAIIDDDVIFNLKVTPGLLFNLTDGKPFMIGSKSTQGKNWRTSSRYFVGPGRYHANFMVQLPFVFPRAVLPKFRDHVGQLHGRKFGGSFDAAFKFWSIRGPIADRSHVAHTTLGNYMWFFANDSAHWAFEWESRTPIPRVGVHIPHTHEFRNASGASYETHTFLLPPFAPINPHGRHTGRLNGSLERPFHVSACLCNSSPSFYLILPTPSQAHWAFEWESRTPIPRVGVHIPHTHEFRNASASAAGPPQRLVKTYVDLTGTYAHEGLCNAFPEGELAHCEDASREQGQIWRYALSGSEWSIFQSGTVNGTVMHDDYKWELKCMYERVVGAKTGEWKGDVDGKRQELVKELTKNCIVPHSNNYVSDNFFLTAFLFASIEQMWPAGIGDVILVLDENDRHVEDIVPPWVKIYYEKNSLDLPGKILQQWSYLWADNYTTAPYIAIIDDDVIFNLKVTPGLLFNMTNGKPYVIGSKNTQSDNWKPSSYYFVGRYFANYMVQLPFVFPRSVLPGFRRRAAKRHKKDFNAAVKYFADHGPSFAK
ncbi:unnamed protein product [Closterium sp. Naga37s-1]|nr:unnamed protein product [Closterium sp. Naga37s-1]